MGRTKIVQKMSRKSKAQMNRRAVAWRFLYYSISAGHSDYELCCTLIVCEQETLFYSKQIFTWVRQNFIILTIIKSFFLHFL